MIRHAKIEFNDSGTPVAQDFDDVYFSNDNGLLESNYVFFEQNNIPARWQTHDKRHFVIAETGFGTGLNFLNTWRNFEQQNNKQIEQLHFISFEKFPIEQQALAQALKAWPELAKYSEQLVANYPTAMAGCHRLSFDNGKVLLDLWFGDIQDTLPQLCFNQHGIVDAWYLDGFAPSKNPDMWQQSLFNNMANLGRPDCTFATFTAAGFVRRGLIEAGFDVQKVKGYGRKREMIVGQLITANDKHTYTEYFARPPVTESNIAIIGGGIASSSLMYALAKRNIATTLFCKDNALAMGASHNHQGAVYPNLQADFNSISEFYAHSFYYAKRTYQQLNLSGYSFAHDWCGVMLHGVTPEKAAVQQRLAEKGNWPKTLIHAVTSEAANTITGIKADYSGLFMPEAGWVSPPQLVNAMATAANELKKQTTHLNTRITEINKDEQGYTLVDDSQTCYGPFKQVIVTCGELSKYFKQTSDIPIQAVRGQVTRVTANEKSSPLNTVLCHKGYFTPQFEMTHCMGATFEKNSESREISQSDNTKNLTQLTSFYPDQLGINEQSMQSAKAAIRCCTPDHMPLVGELADKAQLVESFAPLRQGKHYGFTPYQSQFDDLYIFTGFGARGLCTVPLCAEMLVAELCDEPQPVPTHISELVHPNRFVVRDLKRNKI